MTENEILLSHKVAVVVDGEVVDTIKCDEHTWAIYTSNPIFIDITDSPDSLQIGQVYNG